jgi:hypothetical protein
MPLSRETCNLCGSALLSEAQFGAGLCAVCGRGVDVRCPRQSAMVVVGGRLVVARPVVRIDPIAPEEELLLWRVDLGRDGARYAASIEELTA